MEIEICPTFWCLFDFGQLPITWRFESFIGTCHYRSAKYLTWGKILKNTCFVGQLSFIYLQNRMGTGIICGYHKRKEISKWHSLKYSLYGFSEILAIILLSYCNQNARWVSLLCVTVSQNKAYFLVSNFEAPAFFNTYHLCHLNADNCNEKKSFYKQG